VGFLRRFSLNSSGYYIILEKSRFTMGILGWGIFSENNDMHCVMLKRQGYDCNALSTYSSRK
jgi:hypothetical protein